MFKQRSFSRRIIAMAVLTLSLFLPVLFLATPQASALPNGANCAEGQLQDGVCLIDYGAPTCPPGAVLDADECITVSPADEEPVCPNGSLGVAGACYIVVPRGPGAVVCEVGELVGEFCELRIPAPLNCPAGFSPDEALGGICARFEPAEQGPPSCPEGSRGQPDACYILLAKGPGTLMCEEGELVGNLCVIEGPAPMPSEFQCPVGPEVFLEDDFCFRLVELDDGDVCVAPNMPVIDTNLCKVEVARVPGPPTCVPGFGLVDGTCIRYEVPISSPPQCPPGSVEDINGDCRKPIANAPVVYFCADQQAVLNGTSCVYTAGFEFGPCPDGFGLVGSECVQITNPVVAPPQCPTGSIEDINGDCRKPVADATQRFCSDPSAVLTKAGCETRQIAECDQGDLGPGTCIEEVPAVYYCNDLVVTINMQLGDLGVGTSGPDVILGTDGDDSISAGQGADVICAEGGDDFIRGGRGADVIFGSAGDDTIYGARGADVISGGDDNDVIVAGRGADQIAGDAGDDLLRGGRGQDVLDGGAGIDDCRGGLGNDTASASCETIKSAN